LDDDEDRQPTKTVLRKENRREDQYLCIEIQPTTFAKSLHKMRDDALAEPVEGVSYIDPRTAFILQRHTGRTPELKTQSYYKRSWSSGKANSPTPLWADLNHVPPARHANAGVRPHLALVAMVRILDRTAAEKEAELRMAEDRQNVRAADLVHLRRRHVASLERERAIGVQRPHSYTQERERPDATRSTPADDAGGDKAVSPCSASSSSASLSSSPSLVAGRDGRLKGPVAARYEGLQGLAIPKLSLLRPVSPETLPRLQTRHSFSPSASSRSLSLAPSASSSSLLQRGARSPPPSLVPPASPSPQRATAGYRLAAEVTRYIYLFIYLYIYIYMCV